MTDPRPSDLFQPGDLVNNTYRIEAILGRGGTSDVYRARSEISGRLAALKVLKAEFSSNDEYLVLLTREEEIRDIRHDAVVRYSENNRTSDGHVYLVMDFVDGPGLDQKLKQGPMSAEDLLTVCRRVTEGLQAAHVRGIVHRDLSPDNIILRNGDPAQAVIIDFGIAKDANPGAETIVGNEFAGKYAYAAPEQLAGKTDHRTDIYSLGALLLANFRGASPDPGSNPMEVVNNKSKPLDTSGLPEPLKSILDKMTAPDPADRFQSTSDVLQALDDGNVPEGPAPDTDDGLSDATVIVPHAAAQPDTPTPKPETQPPAPLVTHSAAKPATKKPKPSKSRGGLLAVLMIAVLAIGGAGGYFGGLFDPFQTKAYPPASPYTLVIERQPGKGPRAIGYAPSEAMRAALVELIGPQNGTVELTLASGEIAESWETDIMATVTAAMALDEWRLSASSNRAKLIGKTDDPDIHAQVEQVFSNGLPGALEGVADIELLSLFLPPGEIETVMMGFADCGALKLVDPPVAGFGPTSTITILGAMASPESELGLERSLQAIAGNRPVDLQIDVLNPTLCLIENLLPTAPLSDIEILFANGETGGTPNETGDFVVGANPVIDVTLPAGVTSGYLSVSILDVSGNVFHLLPNIGRQDNAVATLRNGATGPVKLRVAYSIGEAQTNGRLAFQVDDSTLGKSKVLVIHSDKPLFHDMRPTTESASSYAKALSDQDRNQGARIESLDSRILTTING